MNNFQRFFDSPSKLASCIIEHDYDEEYARGTNEYICVYQTTESGIEKLGEFAGSWEFELWLCSNMDYEEWRTKRGTFTN